MPENYIKINSNTRKTFVASITVLMVGILFLWITNDKVQFAQNYQAAFVLGVLLIFLGGYGLVFTAEIIITLDPWQKKLIYESKSRLGVQTEVFTFQEVARISVNRIGKASSRADSFHLVILLKSGKKLFTGRWSFAEDEIRQLADEMSLMIGCGATVPSEVHGSRKTENFILAFILSVVVYAIYYRVKIGPFCTAMWFGTAPTLIMITSFFTSYSILRKRRA